MPVEDCKKNILTNACFALYRYDKLGSIIGKPPVRMDVDLRAWFSAAKFYDILVFNSEHR